MSLLKGNDFYTQPSFSLGNRAARAVWNMTWALLFWPSPRPLHAWRRLLLRAFGAKVGRGCRVYPGARIWAPWNLELGDLATVADGVTLYNQAPIRLGERAIVSQGAHLCTGTHDYTTPNFQLIAKPIEIGAQAWVCAEAFLHPGTVVGEGAVIGARAVASGEFPAWTVCAGHPCKAIKPRVIGEAGAEPV
jgi:putative colanic acid biosynthesis acetyltransferase WcaF